MRNSGIEIVVAIVMACSITQHCFGDVQLFGLDRTRIQGTWTVTDSGGFLREIDRKSIDLNHDGASDLEFTHDYQADTPGGVPIPVAGTLNTAREPLLEIGTLLRRVHHLTEQAQAPDPNQRAVNQAEIDNAIETIRRIQSIVTWNDRELFRGAFGVWQDSPGESGRVVDAGLSARSQPVDVHVVQPAERAQITTLPIQSALPVSEWLTINNRQIPLPAGLNLIGIQRAINRERGRTGVSAEISDRDKIRLLSDSFGSIAGITANSVPIGGGTGALGNLGIETGIDAELAFPVGLGYGGNGNFVERSDGVVIEIGVSDDASVSLMGELNIDLRDGTLEFPFSRDRQNTYARIPNLDIDERKFAGSNGQPLSLGELDVTADSDQQIQNYLGTLDTAEDEVNQIGRNLDRILDEPTLPAGKSQSLSRNQTRLIGDSAVFALEAGDVIGPDSLWSAPGVMDIAGVEFDTWNIESRYFGVELSLDGAAHYGWLEVSITEDSGLELIQAAFESEAGVPIMAGAVPEPDSWCLLFFSGLLFGFIRNQEKIKRRV